MFDWFKGVVDIVVVFVYLYRWFNNFLVFGRSLFRILYVLFIVSFNFKNRVFNLVFMKRIFFLLVFLFFILFSNEDLILFIICFGRLSRCLIDFI